MTDWVKILKKIPEAWTIPSRRSVQELIDDDEYSKALRIVNLKAKKWPKNPDFWGDKGDVLSELERFREAIIAYKKALKLDPKNYANILGLILAYHDSGDFKEVIKCIDKLPSDKIDQDTLVMKADCLSHLGKNSQSLKIFQNLLEDDPSDLDFMDSCVQELIDLGRYKEADKIVDRLIELDPESVNNLNIKSDIALRTGKYKESIKFAQKALKLVGDDEDYAVSWSNISSVQFHQGDHKAALKSVEKSLELDDTLGITWLLSAFINRALGNEEYFEIQSAAGLSRLDIYQLKDVIDIILTQLPPKERKEFEKEIRSAIEIK